MSTRIPAVLLTILVLCRSIFFSFIFTAPTNFSTDLNTVDYTAYDQAITLLCCANGFDKINWYRLDKGDKEWKSFPRAQARNINVLEVGQVLQLLQPKFNDSTSFRCTLNKNGVYVMSHTVRLYVQSKYTWILFPLFVPCVSCSRQIHKSHFPVVCLTLSVCVASHHTFCTDLHETQVFFKHSSPIDAY